MAPCVDKQLRAAIVVFYENFLFNLGMGAEAKQVCCGVTQVAEAAGGIGGPALVIKASVADTRVTNSWPIEVNTITNGLLYQSMIPIQQHRQTLCSDNLCLLVLFLFDTPLLRLFYFARRLL